MGIVRASTKLIILERSKEIEKIKGIKSHWYKVKISLQDTIRTGWVWGRFIAERAFKSYVDLDIKFLIGLHRIYDKSHKNGNIIYKIKAMRDTILLDEIMLNTYDVVRTYETGSFVVVGIKDLDDVISIHIPCLIGCGCNTGELYIFWYDDKFRGVYEAMGTADAQASEGVPYIFPQSLEGEEEFIIKVFDGVDKERQIQENDNDVTHRLIKKGIF